MWRVGEFLCALRSDGYPRQPCAVAFCGENGVAEDSGMRRREKIKRPTAEHFVQLPPQGNEQSVDYPSR